MSDADLNPHSAPHDSTPEASAATPPELETETEEIEYEDVDFEEFDDVDFDADDEDSDEDVLEDSEEEPEEPVFSADEDDDTEVAVERVSKLIAKAGIASRRAAEEMISAGRVTVNGHTITEQGIKADPFNDRIVVDGHPLRISEKPGVVLVFHKPRLVMTTRDDPGGRTTVMDFLPRKWQSLHPVGRLDFDTSGVLLLTDDGELTHLLTHPSHGAEKVYEARVRGTVEHAAVEKLERGVRLDDGVTAPCRAKVMAQRDKNALIQIVIREGRNRQVRRMLDAVGHPVNALRRISFAGVELEGLPAGEFRVLLSGEVKALRKRVEEKKKRLSAPKGKFSKHKVVKKEVIAISAAETAKLAEAKTFGRKKKDTGEKVEPHRPRNAPRKPEAAPLERKGSKVRAMQEGQLKAKKNAPRPRAADARSTDSRSSDSRGANARASSGPRPVNPRPKSDTRPKNDARPRKSEEGAAPKAPRSSAPRPDRAPVANRVDKRWKS